MPRRPPCRRDMVFIGAAVEGLQVRPVGDARRVEEGDLRIFLGQLLQRVGVAESGTEDDVVATVDEELDCRTDRGCVLRDVLHYRNLHAHRLLQLLAGFVQRLRPAAVVLLREDDQRDLGLALELERGGSRSSRHRHADNGGEHSEIPVLHVRAPFLAPLASRCA